MLSDNSKLSKECDEKEGNGEIEKHIFLDGTNEEGMGTSVRAKAFQEMRRRNYLGLMENQIKLAAEKEYGVLLKSNEFIRHKFLVKMPPDFYLFWDFWREHKSDMSGDILLSYLEKTFQLKLVGAFEYLAGRFHDAKIREPGDYLRHWRFFYDPPEFQTIFVRCNSGLHFGYWRDDPQADENLLVAINDASKDCVFEFISGNIFDAFLFYIDKKLPITSFHDRVISDTRREIHKYCTIHRIEFNNMESLIKKRSEKILTKTFHRLGIVVPFDCRTQVGYRALNVTESELKNILKMFDDLTIESSLSKRQEVMEIAMQKLQPIVTAANIAMHECDFGTSFEFGIDLFSSGHVELHSLIQSMLIPTYNLLQRPQFLAIIKSHMDRRRKSINLSIFDIDDSY